MQIVMIGEQDLYITGNPKITYFKIVYRRHTHFAIESIEQLYDDAPDINISNYNILLSKSGDLVSQMYFQIELPAYTDSDIVNNNYWIYGIGNAFISKISISLGGQTIDTQYGDWLNIWSELAYKGGYASHDGYDRMVGNILSNSSYYKGQLAGLSMGVKQVLYVPLQFWFCRNPGLALPLIALQDSEVKISCSFRPFTQLYTNTQNADPTLPTEQKIKARLFVDYIMLDNEERKRFTMVAHEYLIEQLQWNGGYNVTTDNYLRPIPLSFEHPIKEIIWAHITQAHNTESTAYSSHGNSWFNYGKTLNNGGTGSLSSNSYNDDTFYTGFISLNGHAICTPRYAEYFRKVQNYQYHTNIPRTPVFSANDPSTNDPTTTGAKWLLNAYAAQYIYTYSFAISPEDHQPSGSCNFTRLDNAYLNLTYIDNNSTNYVARYGPFILNIYAINYNVLRIMGGKGGIAYFR